MKRIGIVCGAGTVSGKEIMVMELADGLREKGCHVEIVTSHWGSPEFAERFRKLEFPVHKVWFGFISIALRLDCIYMTLAQVLRWPQLLLGFRRFLRAAQPERVIFTNWHSLLTLLPLLKAERDVYWIHDVIPDKPQYRRVFGWLARRLGCFVCVSGAVAGSLRAIGIAPEKVRVIHNGITNPVTAGEAPAAASQGTARIGIIGQIARWKGHADLLQAFCLLAKDFPAAELHVFGRSPDDFEDELRRQVKSLEMAERVVWHGFVSDRTRVYQSMDVCVVPSRVQDSLPTTAIEAGFFGLPVVASRLGGLPEIVEDGVTGFLFEVGNVAELAACLGRLLGDDRLRREMGERARASVRTKFGRERFVEDFMRLLEGR